MKKIVGTALKIFFFLIMWHLGQKLLPSAGTGLPVSSQLIGAFATLAMTIALIVIFWLMDMSDSPIGFIPKPLPGIRIGFFAGAIISILAIVIPCSTYGYDFGSIDTIHGYGLWFLLVLVNVITQEFILRTYLFELLKYYFNDGVAVAFAIILSLALYSNVLQYGVFHVLVVISMNLFCYSLLEYSKSIWAVITMRFIWIASMGLVLGALPTLVGYPHMITIDVISNDMITGGSMMLDGSGMVFVLNMIFAIIFFILKVARDRK